MTEADEVAAAIRAAQTPPVPRFASIGEARAWYVRNNPTWHEWFSHQMLDNVAESLFEQSRGEGRADD